MLRFRTGARLALLATFFAFSACSDQAPTRPDATVTAADHTAGTTGAVLLECPASESVSTSGELDATGGSIQLGGHRLSLPMLGVTVPTSFELTAPASNYMELRVRANDLESFSFNRPATITIDYSRCTRENIEKENLTVWQIDPETKELLQHMGGIDDKVARTVTFETDHLSTFSIAH